MTVFTHIQELLTLQGAVKKEGRKITESDLSIIANAAMIEERGKIVWVGSQRDLNSKIKEYRRQKIRRVSLKNLNVIPAFVDCHTHLVFAGDRQNEFELRNQGMSYQDIAKRGGGIRSTVEATRSASEAELFRRAQERIIELLAQGVATIEIKSGYGLNESEEIKILKVIQKLKLKYKNLNIVSTFLGPHAHPSEVPAEKYLKEILESTLPAIAKKKLADRVDMFVEEGYYSLEQAQKYFLEAQKLGFKFTGHADQLNRTGAGVFLASLGADSADHLVRVSKEDILRLSSSSTTCVLLPVSDFYLKISYPPARELIDAGARVALATDFNPGTAPSMNIEFVGLLARLEMKMSLPEVLVGLTYNGASALSLQNKVGALLPGWDCTFLTIKSSWRDLFYQIGRKSIENVYISGRISQKT